MTFAELKTSMLGIASYIERDIPPIDSIEDRLRRIHEILHEAGSVESAVIQASMQQTSCILLSASESSGTRFPGLFIDTGVHFPQTYELVKYYNTRVCTIKTAVPEIPIDDQTANFGRILHLFDETADDGRGYQTCCHLRKRAPLVKAMKESGYRVAIKGLRRSESLRRASTSPIKWDDEGEFLCVHPLFDWSEQDVKRYIEENDIRISGLYALGYTSIGCMTCTTPTREGESVRAGRWRHLPSAGGYCGINSGEGDPSI